MPSSSVSGWSCNPPALQGCRGRPIKNAPQPSLVRLHRDPETKEEPSPLMRAADSSARLGASDTPAVLTHAERAPSRSVRRARQRTQRPVSLSLAMGKDKSKKDVGAAQVRPALARSALAAIEPAPRPRAPSPPPPFSCYQSPRE